MDDPSTELTDPTELAELARATTRAADLLQALSGRTRLPVLAAVLELAGEDGTCPLDAVVAATGRDTRAVVDDLVRLQVGGLVSLSGRTVRVDPGVLAEAAKRLTARHPVTALLAAEPELGRFFRHGRLVQVPEDGAVTRRIGAALVGLLPAGTELSEPVVNRLLGAACDDHAWLRRLLVDEGFLTRGASRSYVRV